MDWFHNKGYELKYEPLETSVLFNFKPDFKQPTREFYIEHKSNLSSKLNDKIKILKDTGKLVFITDEKWMQDSEKIEEELKNILKIAKDGGYTADFSKAFDNKFKSLNKELEKFIKEVKDAYSLAKSQNLKVKDIKKIKSDLFEHKRIKIFYELFPVVWEHYDMLKKKNSVIDYSDMLSLTLNILEKHKDIRNLYQRKFKCILIDEFQDVNPAQVQLIKYLFTETTDLFCVGDDWQSIYGFQGSDINYILNFSNHFPNPLVVKLKYNFRSTENIIKIGNAIIKKNTQKIDKEVLAQTKSKQKAVVFKPNSVDETLQFIQKNIDSHLKQGTGFTSKDIMILGRNKKHFSELSESLQKYGIRFSTIHKAKGLQAKIVFIAGLKCGPGGFPEVWLSDSINQVIKYTDQAILLEEERRLFYVAVTRAQEYLYFLSDNGSPSDFIDELPKKLLHIITPIF